VRGCDAARPLGGGGAAQRRAARLQLHPRVQLALRLETEEQVPRRLTPPRVRPRLLLLQRLLLLLLHLQEGLRCGGLARGYPPSSPLQCGRRSDAWEHRARRPAS